MKMWYARLIKVTTNLRFNQEQFKIADDDCVGARAGKPC